MLVAGGATRLTSTPAPELTVGVENEDRSARSQCAPEAMEQPEPRPVSYKAELGDARA